MKLQHYQLKLVFSGPLLSQAVGTIALGHDVEMQKDATGLPVINGSLIKGNIRHTLNEFSELLADTQLKKEIDRWFGTETSDQQYTPQRTEVDFDFFWTLQNAYEKSTNPRTRIAIDSTTGTVKDGALQIAEDCFPLGSENPVFSGCITLRFKTSKEQRHFEKWMNKAIDYIPAMGSFKGVGWGKLLSQKSELTRIKLTAPNLSTGKLVEDTTRFGIQLEIDRPFCIGRPRTPESNFIVSADYIAGNVIKGLIARLYDNDSEQLTEKLCFDHLIITHALVTNKTTEQRNLPIPLSLAIHEGTVIDMAGLQKPADQIRWKNAPKFSPDWKDEDKDIITSVIKQTTSSPERHFSLRTEINHKGISEEGKLFSLECIEPASHLWCADIELSNIPLEKQSAVLTELQNKLQHGLYGLGKTKAHANIVFKLDTAYKQKTEPLTEGRQIITLITDARLLPPDLAIQGTNSAEPLKAKYQTYWQRILGDAVTLENYFAQQSLSTAYYHQLRNQSIQKAYYPEWITDAGSVFIINVHDSSGLEKLQNFAVTGLPAHPEIDGSLANWKTTPYLPEHGYGEIEINNPALKNLQRQLNDSI